jgi:hypothetical protein
MGWGEDPEPIVVHVLWSKTVGQQKRLESSVLQTVHGALGRGRSLNCDIVKLENVMDDIEWNVMRSTRSSDYIRVMGLRVQ